MARTKGNNTDDNGIPEKKIVNGKVTNWSSRWDEARQLDHLVESGALDDMKAAEVLEKYPVFQVFNHAPFSGGLRSARNRFNNAIKARKAHLAVDGKCRYCCCDSLLLFTCCLALHQLTYVFSFIVRRQ